MNKCICFCTMLLFVLTTVLFSGCSGITYNPPGGNVPDNRLPGISTGIVPGNSSNTGGVNLPSLPEYDGFDESELYDYLYGIKVAYDSTNYYSSVAQSSYIKTMLVNLDQMLENGYGTFDAGNYMATYPSTDYTKTDVTRAVWIYNLIDQYELLAKLILTDLYGTYGLGYADNLNVKSAFYPTLNLLGKNPTTENLNIINFTKTATVNTLTFANPNFGTEYDYADVETITINLETQKFIVGTTEFDIVVPTELVSEFSSWKLNQLNNEKMLNSLIPNFSFANPVYNAEKTEPNDFSTVQTLYVSGTANNNQITYQVSSTEPMINAEPTENELLNDYVNTYSLFLAYKMFEISSSVRPADMFNGLPEEITKESFLFLIPQYLENGGMLGFSEQYKVPQAGEFTFVEDAVEMIRTTFVGYSDNAIQTTIQNSLNAWLAQYVTVTENVATLVSATTTNAVMLFPLTPNVEWEDILSSKLFETKGESFVYDYENIVDIVFMVNPELETPKYFSEIILAFLSNESTVDLKTYFRYVQAGQEKIFDLFDYTLKSDPIILDNGTVIDMSNSFMGSITPHGEEVTMEYLENTTMLMNNKTAPNANTFKNYELLINGFTNNLASDFKQSANQITNNNRYAYDSAKKAVFYNETAENCDFIELSLVATSESNKINYSFLFSSFSLADIEE